MIHKNILVEIAQSDTQLVMESAKDIKSLRQIAQGHHAICIMQGEK